MSDSLRDLLLKSGLVSKLKVEAAAKAPSPKKGFSGKRPDRNSNVTAKPSPKLPAEPDLAQAYALRARQEKQDREHATREAVLLAQQKRERKEKLNQLLKGKELNAPQAELPRHFSHANKIRRIYCTPEQLPKLNQGELGIVQWSGRYLLVERSIALEAQSISPTALVLLCDPDSTKAEDDIPADIIW